MKNITLITCLLFVNLSFSQKDSKPILKKVFYSNVEENHYQANTFNPFELAELAPEKIIKPTNNSEGKFPFYSNNSILLNLENSTESASIVQEIVTVRILKSNNVFIDKLVLKILQDQNIDISDFKKGINFNGDRNLSFYKNYAVDINKLIVAIRLSQDIEMQLGKDIYRSIQKINKSEIDISLFNNLNLLVFNF
jgi:hypothetical protein|tara:strand:+ start:275 stop:859 length:585 start_codon:yes stop_codon:yes gene_type:complete